MKKILAIACLLSMGMCEDVIFADPNDLSYLNDLPSQYLAFLSFADGSPCDIPDSEQCFKDAQEACLDFPKEVMGDCMRVYIRSNNTASYQSEYADTAEKFVKEIFMGDFTKEKQKKLNDFLQKYKENGYKPEYFLLDKQIEGKTNLEYISNNNLLNIATEIRNVLGSLQNNQALNEYMKNNKIKDDIKKILFD
ncbi:hypothetical protein [Campylobacter hyointestinalis]|uniref:hypothetical protein n=1 Tax=Campylobacter hyointestinalis TaxID=198 RepID=UPI000DCEB2F3|nr:hypothetical protein [Campylobacter hyointestinalis]RAZ55813.1 hypothetical protein CHL10074_04180 [Campylobacter hyointestinalis subsp. lawsonii]RAZ63671.1 hypothetical protein CHL9767_06135 [Campylobacter hyointestinalis subsp. lawsonii]